MAISSDCEETAPTNSYTEPQVWSLINLIFILQMLEFLKTKHFFIKTIKIVYNSVRMKSNLSFLQIAVKQPVDLSVNYLQKVCHVHRDLGLLVRNTLTVLKEFRK